MINLFETLPKDIKEKIYDYSSSQKDYHKQLIERMNHNNLLTRALFQITEILDDPDDCPIAYDFIAHQEKIDNYLFILRDGYDDEYDHYHTKFYCDNGIIGIVYHPRCELYYNHFDYLVEPCYNYLKPYKNKN